MVAFARARHTSSGRDPGLQGQDTHSGEPNTGRERGRQEADPAGTAVSSPMMGIYYDAPSPGSPPFVKVGDAITAGQVVGLIEAMKVFNEITSGLTGTVQSIVAKSGQLVQPGEPLIFIQ